MVGALQALEIAGESESFKMARHPLARATRSDAKLQAEAPRVLDPLPNTWKDGLGRYQRRMSWPPSAPDRLDVDGPGRGRSKVSVHVEGARSGADAFRPGLELELAAVLDEHFLPALKFRHLGIEDDAVEVEDYGLDSGASSQIRGLGRQAPPF